MGIIKRGRFGGLYWRVAVSYFLVTLLAALTIEAATTIGPFLREVQNVQQAEPAPSAQLLEQREAPQVAPYLEETPPDQQAMQRWLSGPFFEAISLSQPTFLAVVDQHGQVLAAASCSVSEDLTSAIGHCTAAGAAKSAAVLEPAPIQEAIDAALSGDSGPVNTMSPDPAKQTFIAVPVQSSDGQVLGALITFNDNPSPGVNQSPGLSNLGELVSIFLHNLQPAGWYFILLATALGTVTGLLISGGITRRLRRITLAAAAWSKGEFQVEVADRSRDEVGQLARDLNQMAEKIQTLLATRQELAVIEERNRLARELHDSVKQHVFANALLIRAARKGFTRDPDKAQAYLAEAEELAGQVQQELIDLIRALRPAAIADKGLADVLQEYTTDWSRRMGIAVDMRVQGERTTPLDIEEALFRVAQEALTNVARHSDAEQVEVSLAWAGEQVSLTIRDNGKGFDPLRAAGKGVGLASMRERVEALGGTLAISTSASGTTVEASVPLVSSSLHNTAEVVV